MKHVLDLNLGSALALCEAMTKLDGYPARGAEIPGNEVSRRVIAPTWTGAGSCPFGWTDKHVPMQHPTDPVRYRVAVTDFTAANLLDSHCRGRCNQAQRTLLDAMVTVEQLPEEWAPLQVEE